MQGGQACFVLCLLVCFHFNLFIFNNRLLGHIIFLFPSVTFCLLSYSFVCHVCMFCAICFLQVFFFFFHVYTLNDFRFFFFLLFVTYGIIVCAYVCHFLHFLVYTYLCPLFCLQQPCQQNCRRRRPLQVACPREVENASRPPDSRLTAASPVCN